MAEGSRLVQHKHPNGTTYVYEIISNVWDPGKKQSRNKQVCIGKIDPDTGELIPSRRLLKEDRGAAVDPAVQRCLAGRALAALCGHPPLNGMRHAATA